MMKRTISLLSVLVSLLLASSLASTLVVADETQSKAAAATAAQQQAGQPLPYPATRGGMMTGGSGMMSRPMMSGTGMVTDCPAMMSDLDPKTRGQMMQIQGKMMSEMGALMMKRGKEIEQGK